MQNGFSRTGASPLTVSPSSVVYESSAAQKESKSSELRSLITPAPIQEFYLNDNRTGWKIEAQTDETHNVDNKLYRTENGGADWIKLDDSKIGSFPAGAVGAARFGDANKGWVAVHAPQQGDPYLYETTDGGDSWSKTELKIPVDFDTAWFDPKIPLQFEGTEKGIFIAKFEDTANKQEPNPLLFYVTSDGGAHWSDPIRSEEGELGGVSWKTDRLTDQTGRSWSITIDGRTWTFKRSDK